jgi:hypothetical protein
MSTKVLRVQPSNGDSNVAKMQILPYTPRNDAWGAYSQLT